MASFVESVVCDSCVFMCMVTGDKDQRALFDSQFMNDAKNGVLSIYISEVTVAECCKLTYAGIEDGKRIDVFSKVEAFLANEYMRRLPVTPDVSRYAATLIRLYSLETCDALIVGTALSHKSLKLFTRDTSSLCKKLRKSQIAPASLNGARTSQPVKAGPMFADEKETIERLSVLDIVDLNLVQPLVAAKK